MLNQLAASFNVSGFFMEPRSYSSARYLPLGDTALVIEFGNTISPVLNQQVMALNEAVLKADVDGVEELVPTYRSLLVRYNPLKTTHDQLVSSIKTLEKFSEKLKTATRGSKITIPVVYGREYGPDLEFVAKYHGLTQEQVVLLHSQTEYRVYMVGFVAGFPYLGEVSDEIATPRLETPRLKVPAGSVGIAEKQTGVYPCEAPGGWRIIGRTPVKLFDPLWRSPSLLQTGKRVRFKPISEKEFKTFKSPPLGVARSSFLEGQKGKVELFQVMKPGLLTTVQDEGRFGYLKYGIPISGAMDTFSFVLANLLVGNDPNDSCLETTLVGPELQAMAETQIAITGGDSSPQINGRDVPMWHTLKLQKGDKVSLGKMESGCRAYVSVRGGINAVLVLGSRSTYLRGGFGGINGRPLKAGDVVEGPDMPFLQAERALPEELKPQFKNHFTISVVLGPQDDMFTEQGLNTFLSCQYKVTLEADRMGYRLQGPLIEHKAEAEIVSDALLPGAVQVPKNGQPIVIMRDAQTTGGYPKIAVAPTSDVSLLGQARPNDTVEFSAITMSEAHEKLLEHNRLLDNLGDRWSH
jgi:KipI family sensor histidine kinase inhibitor